MHWVLYDEDLKVNLAVMSQIPVKNQVYAEVAVLLTIKEDEQ